MNTKQVISDQKPQLDFGFEGCVQGPLCLVSTTLPPSQPYEDESPGNWKSVTFLADSPVGLVFHDLEHLRCL